MTKRHSKEIIARRDPLRLAIKLERGAELDADERQAAAAILRQAHCIKVFGKVNLDEIFAKARTRESNQWEAIDVLVRRLPTSANDKTKAAKRAVFEAIANGRNKVVAIVEYFKAAGMTQTAAQKKCAELLGRPLDDIKSYYRRRTKATRRK